MSNSILVIGCGSIGERHVRCLLSTGRADVTACDTNTALLEKVGCTYGVQTLPEFRGSQSTTRFDGIVVCTPAHTHLHFAFEALKHGAGVLIEKPLSTGLKGVDELCDEITRSGRFVGIAYIYHFMPWILGVREFLATGELGRPLHVAVTTGQHFPTFRPAYREIYYARHETGGGAIQDALTHVANAVEWLVGPTTQLYCDAAHQALEGVSVEDTVNIAARNGNVLVNYALNQFQAPNEMTMQLHCEHGSVKIEGHEQRFGILRRGATEWQWHRSAPLERDDIFKAQANAFLDALSGKQTPLCSFDEAVQTLKFNLAALASSASKLPIFIQ